ncbi:urease accessory protein UreE [Riemerella anatipestifer]|uniref:urease accessory protein UreE n=1 Tax=Riemerella anatipestifer TaxID=34085 RepID=UPI0030BF06E9
MKIMVIEILPLFLKILCNRMVIIEEVKKGVNTEGLVKDILQIEWYETSKTIMRRKTVGGKEIAIRKNSRVSLQDGDILWSDEQSYIEVVIKPCECIVVKPRNIKEMGIVCFEIGNMHLPIYIDDDNQVNVAYEAPLFNFLERSQYSIDIETKKLLQTNMLTIHQIKR